MEPYLPASILGLMFVALFSFVIVQRNHRWILAIFVPIILICGTMGVFSYKSLLGYPVEITWSQMPDEWTAIFFRVENKSSISIWLLEDKTTRLVKLPYIKAAEEGLEAERAKMGKGIPVTFGKKKGEGDGDEEEDGEKSGVDWKYKVDSYGDPIKGKMPGKGAEK